MAPKISNLRYDRINFAGAVSRVVLSRIVLLMVTLGCATSTAIAWAPISPGEAMVRGTIDLMRQLPSAKDPVARRKLLNSLDRSLALDLLAKHALGPQWAKLNQPERERFIALFTDSLEKLAFPRAAEALREVQVTYQGQAKDIVRTTIAKPDGGKVPIDYVIAERGRRWQIVDVSMDRESLSKAVVTRIQSALKQEGYQKLLEEMRKAGGGG